MKSTWQSENFTPDGKGGILKIDKNEVWLTDFTIENAPERLKKEGDLWKPVLGKGMDMAKALERLIE